MTDVRKRRFDRLQTKMQERIDKDRHKRKLWWVWLIWGLAFLVLEGIALWTKEKTVPTLSRTFWAFIDWLVEQVGEKRRRTVTVILIVILLIAGIWAAFHLGGGECFAGLC